MTNLTDKVALITGAGSGIGQASAISMAAQGATVMCTDIDTQAAEGTVGLITEAGGQADSLPLDVSDAQEVADALATTRARMGKLDVLFNNAGVGGGYDWHQTIAINLTGVFNGLSQAAPMMAEQGGGVIINTASVAGLVALVPPADPEADALAATLEASGGAYVAAKHGVAGLTKQFAVDFGRFGVRVNAIAPGFIETPMTAEFRETPEGEQYLIDLHPLGRLGKSEEIASVASFLASDAASFITGVVLPVDGGYTAR